MKGRRFWCCGLLLAFASGGCRKPSEDTGRVHELESRVQAFTRELEEAKQKPAEEVEKAKREFDVERAELKRNQARLERDHSRALLMLERSAIQKPPPPPSEDTVSSPTASVTLAPAAAAPLPADLKDLGSAVILIEGDHGRGTGFMVKTGGKFYLYTAAHVFSGNSKLAASNIAGRKFTKFGSLEVADGADLVRLEVLEDDPGASLEIAPPGSAVAGSDIMVLGDGGGVGVVAEVRGKVVGLSAVSVEVDAGVIQGNSGGPVIVTDTRKVIGVVTHLTAKRDDIWAQGTRLGEVRRFACRVDRDWNWQPMTISTFLADSKRISDFDRMTKIGFAISSLNPSGDGLRLDTKVSENQTVLSILSEAKDLPLVAGVIDMNSQLVERRVRLSEADLKKQFRSVMASTIQMVNRGSEAFVPAKFNSYHKKEAEESIGWREKANDALKDRLESLSR